MMCSRRQENISDILHKIQLELSSKLAVFACSVYVIKEFVYVYKTTVCVKILYKENIYINLRTRMELFFQDL